MIVRPDPVRCIVRPSCVSSRNIRHLSALYIVIVYGIHVW
jgi:hypothetical protein